MDRRFSKSIILAALVAQVLSSSPLQAEEARMDGITLADGSQGDHYVCATYGNCGKCGGACNPKNPDTPGLTPEEKAQAEKYQKEHPKGEKGAPKMGPSAPGEENCGALCSATDEPPQAPSKQTSAMREKRLKL